MKNYMSMSEKIQKALNSGEIFKERLLNDPTYQSNISLEKKIIEEQLLYAIQEHSIVENGIVKLIAHGWCFWIRGSSSFWFDSFDESKLYQISERNSLEIPSSKLYAPCIGGLSTRNFYAKDYSTKLYASDIISCFESVIKNFGAKKIVRVNNLSYANRYPSENYCIAKTKIQF